MLPKIVVGWQSEASDFLISLGKKESDVLSLDGDKLPVEELREWLNFCDNLTKSDNRYVILLTNADSLSPEAQNTLLKPLEEKRDSVEMYLLVKSENKLLPTILSRCEILSTRKVAPTTKYWADTIKLWRGQPADITTYCDAFPLEDLNLFLTEVISRMKLELVKGPSLKRIKIINCFVEASQDVSVGNVNKKLAMENLLLRTWRLIKTLQ